MKFTKSFTFIAFLASACFGIQAHQGFERRCDFMLPLQTFSGENTPCSVCQDPCPTGEICCPSNCSSGTMCRPIPFFSSDCPPGIDFSLCPKSPCRFETCPRFPDAQCIDDYCGGCNAVFINRITREVIPRFACDRNSNWPECPLRTEECIRPVALDEDCPRVPGVVVYADCDCTPRFLDPRTGRTLSPIECGSVFDPRCPPFVFPTTGIDSSNRVCPLVCPRLCGEDEICCPRNCVSVIEAVCVSTSNVLICPPDIEISTCSVPPCRAESCSRFPQALCQEDLCGGCSASFTNRETGEVIPKFACERTSNWPECLRVIRCGNPIITAEEGCPRVPGAVPQRDCDCSIIFTDPRNGKTLSPIECDSGFDQRCNLLPPLQSVVGENVSCSVCQDPCPTGEICCPSGCRSGSTCRPTPIPIPTIPTSPPDFDSRCNLLPPLLSVFDENVPCSVCQDPCPTGEICCPSGCREGTTCRPIPIPIPTTPPDIDPRCNLLLPLPSVPDENVPCSVCQDPCPTGEICCPSGCREGTTCRRFPFLPSECPPSLDIQPCFNAPCQFGTCPRFPDAICLDDFCGGCEPAFIDMATLDVIPRFACDRGSNWPECLRVITCLRSNLTAEEGCPRVPGAVLQMDCDCSIIFTDPRNGRTLSPIECGTEFDSRCPPILFSSSTSNPSLVDRPCPRACPRQCEENEICCQRNCVSIITEASCIPIPDTVVTCPSLNGSDFLFFCSNENNVGSECQLSCPSGQFLVGVIDITCMENGRWNESLRGTQCKTESELDPRCPAVQPIRPANCPICPDLCEPDEICCPTGCPGSTRCIPIPGVRCSPLEDSGYVGSCTNFNLAGSLCKLGCELGQHLRTNHRNGYKPKVRCLSNGEWHPSLSLIENCREGFDPRCPAVNSDQGGVCSICQVPCPDNRICCPTACSGGSNCIEVRCPALEDSNYVGTCTNVNRVGSICRLSCQPGERLTSARRVRCLSDGSWYPPLERIEDCQEGFDPKCPAVRPGVISICPICETPCPIDTTCCENGCGSTCIDNNQLNSCPGVSIPNLRYQCNRQVCYLSCDRGTVLVGPRKTSCNYLRRNSNYIRCRRVFYSYYGYRG